MLVELGVVEQRFQAVLEVLGGASVTNVARRYGVARQPVHRWLRRYAESGVSGLVDESSRPHTCPHQMPARTEARVVEMRWAHPGWGPRTRNGTSSKTLLTDHGEVPVAMPRDRDGSFDPKIVEKGQTHFDGFDDKIILM